jgi:hypothetical protein
VMAFPTVGKIGVFNFAAAKFDGFVDCEDERPLIAAGGRVLAVYLPQTDLLETYDLTTLQKLSSKKCSLPGPLTYIGMGLNNPSRIVALYCVKAPNKWPITEAVTFGVPDLKTTPLIPDTVDGRNPLWDIADYGFSAKVTEDGSSCVVDGYGSGFGTRILKLGRGGKCQHIFLESVARGTSLNGFSQLGDFLIFDDKVFDHFERKGTYQVRSSANRLVPIAGYPGFLEKSKREDFLGFEARKVPGGTVLTQLPVAKDIFPFSSHDPQIMLASAACDRIAFITGKDKRLRIFPLGLKAGGNAGIAQAGKRFEKKLTIAPNSTVQIQSGPKGLTYDAKQNVLTWDVPADIKKGQAIQVLMLVTAPDGKQDYVTEKISVP